MVRVGIAANDHVVAANANGWHFLSAVGGLAGVLHYFPSRRSNRTRGRSTRFGGPRRGPSGQAGHVSGVKACNPQLYRTALQGSD